MKDQNDITEGSLWIDNNGDRVVVTHCRGNVAIFVGVDRTFQRWLFKTTFVERYKQITE